MRLISKKTLLLFFLPGAIFMGAFLIYPIMKMVFDSFFKVGITGDRAFIGLDNYIKAFTAGGFMKQLKNTLVYILIAVSVETILGFIFALLFELNYKGSKIVRSFMMTPLMIAPLVAGLIWKLMMSSNFGIVNEMLMRIGILSNASDILWLADSRWSLIACCIADIWLTTPFMMLMILAGLQGLDGSMVEAARMDGAYGWRLFRHIKLPYLYSVLTVALVMAVNGLIKAFDIPYIATYGGPGRSTELVATYMYKIAFASTKYGYASSIAVFLVVESVLLVSILRKFMSGRRTAV